MTVRRDSIRDQIRRAIAERIVTGVYPPGERLVELRIAREFGVSQGPVREAFLELEASGLVECGSYKGTRVRAVRPQEMREAYQARGMIEQEAAPAAAKVLRGDVGRLKAEHEAIIKAALDGNLAEMSARNSAFHRLIVEASGNTVLLRLWDSLSLETLMRIRISLPGAAATLMRSVEPHVPIIEALERGDGKTAGRLLRQHAESLPAAEFGPGEG
jgi:DNA-binding GntR family transcriptional regulator